MSFTESLLIGFDISENDHCVLVVGKKRLNESVEIINAFQGEEAKDLYKKLTEVKKADARISE